VPLAARRPEQLVDNSEIQVSIGQAGPSLQHPHACGWCRTRCDRTTAGRSSGDTTR